MCSRHLRRLFLVNHGDYAGRIDGMIEILDLHRTMIILR